MSESIHAQVAVIRDATGWQPRLRVFEAVERVIIETDVLKVWVSRVRATETQTRFTITHRGMEVLIWKRDADGYWHQDSEVTMFAVDSEMHLKFDTPTPIERAEKRSWERDCYRPGTARNPMDRYGA